MNKISRLDFFKILFFIPLVVIMQYDPSPLVLSCFASHFLSCCLFPLLLSIPCAVVLSVAKPGEMRQQQGICYVVVCFLVPVVH